MCDAHLKIRFCRLSLVLLVFLTSLLPPFAVIWGHLNKTEFKWDLLTCCRRTDARSSFRCHTARRADEKLRVR